MAHFFVRTDCGGDWEPVPIGRAVLGLAGDPPRVTVKDAPPAPRSGSAAVVRRCDSAAGGAWVLMAPADVNLHINGEPLPSGIRVLAHRDAVRLGHASPVFFSSEQLARIEPFPGSAQPTHCARSKSEIAAGTPAVRCVSCGLWFHETPELPGWTYSPTCLCGQPTALDAGYTWRPDEL